MEMAQVVAIGVTLLGLTGIVLAFLVARRHFDRISSESEVSVGITRLPAAAFWKLAAFVALVLLPLATMAIANYNTVEGVHEVEACGRCHVMLPMVNDLRDPASETLAARHFKNRWIPTQQCYACHSDYGLAGNLGAKMEGFRHLARYTTHTYAEPIRIRGHFDNQNCLKCHAGMPVFEEVQSHHTVRQLLETSAVSCLNCHGAPHPTAWQRTPGSPDYARLMQRLR